MIRQNESALICDLAETYHIYDYKQLPLLTVAAFSCGLREDSRIKMELNNQKTPLDTLLLASLADSANLSLWFQTKDGQKGKNRPSSIVNALNGVVEKEKNEKVFDTGEEFERARKKLAKESQQGDEENGN